MSSPQLIVVPNALSWSPRRVGRQRSFDAFVLKSATRLTWLTWRRCARTGGETSLLINLSTR